MHHPSSSYLSSSSSANGISPRGGYAYPGQGSSNQYGHQHPSVSHSLSTSSSHNGQQHRQHQQQRQQGLNSSYMYHNNPNPIPNQNHNNPSYPNPSSESQLYMSDASSSSQQHHSVYHSASPSPPSSSPYYGYSHTSSSYHPFPYPSSSHDQYPVRGMGEKDHLGSIAENGVEGAAPAIIIATEAAQTRSLSPSPSSSRGHGTSPHSLSYHHHPHHPQAMAAQAISFHPGHPSASSSPSSSTFINHPQYVKGNIVHAQHPKRERNTYSDSPKHTAFPFSPSPSPSAASAVRTSSSPSPSPASNSAFPPVRTKFKRRDTLPYVNVSEVSHTRDIEATSLSSSHGADSIPSPAPSPKASPHSLSSSSHNKKKAHDGISSTSSTPTSSSSKKRKRKTLKGSRTTILCGIEESDIASLDHSSSLIRESITNNRAYLIRTPFFSQPVEAFVAVDEGERIVLFKAASVASEVNCAANMLAMYLSRRRKVQKGEIFQASGFEFKDKTKNVGLKTGGYFISLSACKAFKEYQSVKNSLSPPLSLKKIKSEEA